MFQTNPFYYQEIRNGVTSRVRGSRDTVSYVYRSRASTKDTARSYLWEPPEFFNATSGDFISRGYADDNANSGKHTD
jgi:hypothetical protein